MAEIGLVASVVGVAAYGTSVATKLYETADVMIHAQEQIAGLAKHVSQFTAVLRHLAKVLETGERNCSKDLLREITKIRRSCKATFREIKATIRSPRWRHFAPVKWLFKKAKAKELEAKLDSEKSTLQVMIHTITVSKLGDMQSRSVQDSKQLTDLREEIQVLKTVIVENYHNVMKLQRAEQRTEAEIDGNTGIAADGPKFPQLPPYEADDAGPRQQSSSSDSESDGDDPTPDKTAGSDDNAPKSGPNQAIAVQRPPERKDTKSKDRTSDLLLQMVPYRPTVNRSDRLISAGPGPASLNPKSALDEAGQSVRLLLDKWTISGSTPVNNLLIQGPPGTSITNLGSKGRRHAQRDRGRYPVESESSDNDFDAPRSPPIYGRGRRSPSRGVLRDASSALWAPYEISRPDQIGFEFIESLRSVSGGIIYMRSNGYRQVWYIEGDEFYRFDLVPSTLVPPDKQDFSATVLGKSWVSRAALDLLGYKYSEELGDAYSIAQNLVFSEIEELVRLSYQGLGRSLQDRSKKIIEENGWRDIVAAARRRLSRPSPLPQTYHTRRRTDARSAQYPGMDAEYSPAPEPGRAPWREDGARGQAYPYRDGGFVPERERIEIVERDVKGASRAGPGRSAPGETRYTIPRLRSAPQIEMPPAPPNGGVSSPPIPGKGPPPPMQPGGGSFDRLNQAGSRPSAARTSDSQVNGGNAGAKVDPELVELRRKLEAATKKKEEAEKAKDIATASDLTYYAIPELQERIERRNRELGAEELRVSGDPRTMVDTELEELRRKLETAKKRKDDAERARDIATASDLMYYAIPELQERIKERERKSQERIKERERKLQDEENQTTKFRAKGAFVESESGSDSDDGEITISRDGMDLYE